MAFIRSHFGCESACFVLQDVSAESSLSWPELYKPGLRRELTTPFTLSLSLLHAVYASLVCFFIPCGVFYNTAFDYQTMALTVAMSTMFTATTEVRATLLIHNNVTNSYLETFCPFSVAVSVQKHAHLERLYSSCTCVRVSCYGLLTWMYFWDSQT